MAVSKQVEQVERDKTLLDSPAITKKQLDFLVGKTPPSQVYTRPAKGGGSDWKYVKGSWVKKVLNYVFGWDWDFEVVDHGKEGNTVWVLGKLTVRTPEGKAITKTQFGRADIKWHKDKTKGMLDFGNDLKAATTDALKKCAAELGIASDVYAEEERREIKSNPREYIEAEVVEDKEPTANQIQTISSLAEKLGKTVTTPKTLQEASKLIGDLSRELKEKK